MNGLDFIRKKKTTLIAFGVVFALVIVALSFYLLHLFNAQNMSEIELAQEFLNTSYTVTKSESSDFLKRITSGSLTEADTYKPITRKYARLMTKSGLQEAVESRQIWSNETIMAMNQCEMAPGEISIHKSKFYTAEKPSYSFSVHVSVIKIDDSGENDFNPTGIVYLEKNFWGWKISRIIDDDKTSIAFQMQTAK